MKPETKSERLTRIARRTTADLLGRAAVIAFWGSGLLGGVVAALAPNLIVAAARSFICRGSSLVELDTTTSGNTTSFVVNCDGMDRTIGSVAVLLAGAFLVVFWLGLAALWLHQQSVKKKLEGN